MMPMKPMLQCAIALFILFSLPLVACGSGELERRIPAPGIFVFTQGVDLWIQDDDGARLLLAAQQDQQLLMPAISPDGQRVAYVVFQLTQAEGMAIGTDLALIEIADPEQEILLRHERQGEYVWTPRWTPDGAALIFTHEVPEQHPRVARIELDSGEIETLREDARDADISPDGSRIVFVSAPYGGDPHLLVRNLSDGSDLPLDPQRAWQPRPVRIPRFSPDGESVIFSAGQFLPQVSSVALGLNGPEDIWSVDLDSGQLTQLAAIGEDQPDFAISQDGRHVLIMGAFGLYLVETPPRDPPYAIAPGEFHGGIDWIGNVSDRQWQQIRDSVFEIPEPSQ